MGAVRHKVIGPNVVSMRRPESGTGPIIKLQTTPLRLLLGNLQPLLTPDAFNTLDVDVDFLHGHYGPPFSTARPIAVLQPADLNILTRNCFSMVEV